MKLLFYIDTIGYGGAERVIVNLANQLQVRGYECTVVTSFEKTPEYSLLSGVSRVSLNKEYIDSFLKRNFTLTLRLRKLIKKIKPDVVIVFLPEPIFRTSFATIGLHTKLIYSIRNAPEKEYGSTIYKILGQYLLPRAHGFVFQTIDARNYFRENIRNKSEVIVNQVDEKFYHTNLAHHRKGIVTTGRLAPQKNHKILIDAFNLIKERTSENLYIYGEGFMMNELHEYVKAKNLVDRVFIPGPIKNVPEVLREAKIYVLSSDYEGMPNGLMEAMALGLPCVSTDCPSGGPKALFGKKQSGFLVPVTDAHSLANAIITILSSEETMVGLSEENKRKAKDFSPEHIILKWEKFIIKIYNS